LVWLYFRAVIRANTRPVDAFRPKHGYASVDALTCRFSWKNIGARDETEKPVQFRMRALQGGRGDFGDGSRFAPA